jgi:hypothetical protein
MDIDELAVALTELGVLEPAVAGLSGASVAEALDGSDHNVGTGIVTVAAGTGVRVADGCDNPLVTASAEVRGLAVGVAGSAGLSVGVAGTNRWDVRVGVGVGAMGCRSTPGSPLGLGGGVGGAGRFSFSPRGSSDVGVGGAVGLRFRLGEIHAVPLASPKGRATARSNQRRKRKRPTSVPIILALSLLTGRPSPSVEPPGRRVAGWG